jgi:hypothetical protein
MNGASAFIATSDPLSLLQLTQGTTVGATSLP